MPLACNPPFSEPRNSSSARYFCCLPTTSGLTSPQNDHHADISSSRSSSYNKGDTESPSSTPTTPTLGPAKDFELKRTASGHSIPAFAQTSTISAEAEGVLSASPKSASLSLGEATQKPAVKSSEGIPSEELPTPPQTPGHSSEAATTTEVDEPQVEEPETLEEETPVEPEVPQVKKISYLEDADLDIKIQEADGLDAIYAVRSSALENSSAVWKQTISSQPSLDLTSDPATGLDVIFSIAHYQFQNLPTQVDGTQLHDIALVAEKYQTLHLLLPFLKGWLASLTSPIADAEKSLITGWILGQAHWFSQGISQSANSASVTADGTLLDSEGHPWADKPISAEVVELIAATRAAAIQRIVKAVSDPMAKLLNPELYPDEEIRYCHASEEDAAIREECEQLLMGSAIMGLTKAKLWPAPEVSRVRASPAELARTYKDIRMRRYQAPGLRFQEGVTDVHAGCGFGHHDEIESILNEPVTLPAAVVEELQSRAKKAGVSNSAVSEGFFDNLVVEAPGPVDGEEVVAAAEIEEPASAETVVADEVSKEENCKSHLFS